MTVRKQDFVMWAGKDKILEFTLVDAAGAPFDPTGGTITWVGRSVPNGTTTITRAGSALSLGLFRVVLVPTDTQPAGSPVTQLTGAYDFEVGFVDGGGVDYPPLATGSFYVHPSYT